MPHRQPHTRRRRGALVAATIVLAFGGLAPATASAGQRWGCSAWVTSTGQPGGGVSGLCTQGSTRYAYRVVGLCQNIFTRGSRWIYGPWLTSGVSHAKCSWAEIPQPYPFMQS